MGNPLISAVDQSAFHLNSLLLIPGSQKRIELLLEYPTNRRILTKCQFPKGKVGEDYLALEK